MAWKCAQCALLCQCIVTPFPGAFPLHYAPPGTRGPRVPHVSRPWARRAPRVGAPRPGPPLPQALGPRPSALGSGPQAKALALSPGPWAPRPWPSPLASGLGLGPGGPF